MDRTVNPKFHSRNVAPSHLMSWLCRRWPEVLGLFAFLGLSTASLILPLVSPSFAAPRFAPAFNAGLSIGTGGLVSFLFYYLVNERLEHRRRKLLQNSVRDTYEDAKSNIALAIIHASQKGGRADLSADFGTIARMLNTDGFRSSFEGGREASEGYYAFQNQMSSRTPEYDEIVFNLKVIARAGERLIDNNAVDDERTHGLFVRLSTLVQRIEQSGPGYDESKILCSFIWEIFAGWSFVDGHLGYDPIKRTIERL